ncbi:MAG TPA: hypothetical protein PLY66_10610 [Acidobacteriota bacterium]|nr:hypothetical protein [Acidobacteriota bacterium]HOT01447.1 hypothetical protein [Acidobacteriota bacterium]HQF87846.1 hypothetical protein [Acidobacteriota bacterium]HQG92562.1 hypothetical protein [Acidobacteriota bacterium]HQK87117.1 hypothetical protein [Acidobacteriota bacterium]
MRDLLQAATSSSKRPAASTVFWIAAVAIVVALSLQADDRPARPAGGLPANPHSVPTADAAAVGCSPVPTGLSKEKQVVSAIPDPDPRRRSAGSGAMPARVETATFAMG